MTIGNLILISIQIITVLGVVSLWVKWHRPPKEDPRLGKGLQLLQAKISILEDLSDRTDRQVKQISNLLEQKMLSVQEMLQQAEKINQRVQQSMHKSLEMAELFEEKVPHEEALERQMNKKYIEAAQLAHQGVSALAISQKLSIDPAEAEFIVKVNRHQLMFAPEAAQMTWAESESGGISTGLSAGASANAGTNAGTNAGANAGASSGVSDSHGFTGGRIAGAESQQSMRQSQPSVEQQYLRHEQLMQSRRQQPMTSMAQPLRESMQQQYVQAPFSQFGQVTQTFQSAQVAQSAQPQQAPYTQVPSQAQQVFATSQVPAQPAPVAAPVTAPATARVLSSSSSTVPGEKSQFRNVALNEIARVRFPRVEGKNPTKF